MQKLRQDDRLNHKDQRKLVRSQKVHGHTNGGAPLDPDANARKTRHVDNLAARAAPAVARINSRPAKSRD